MRSVLDNKVIVICEFEIQICVIMVKSGTFEFDEENACMTDTFWTTSLAFVLKETYGGRILIRLDIMLPRRSCEDMNAYENCSIFFIASKLSSVPRKAEKYGSFSSST